MEPVGGLDSVPILTPFPKATLASMLVHWLVATNATFEALVSRPYWSTTIWGMLATEPYPPGATVVVGKFVA